MALLIPLPGLPSLPGRKPPTPPRITSKLTNTNFTIYSSLSHLERAQKEEEVEEGLRLGTRTDTVRWLYGQVRQSETPPIDTEDEDGKHQDYYLNTGYAIRTLRDDFPQLFYRDLTFDIYRDDVVFRDPLNTFHGIDNYKTIFWALRFHGSIFFRALWVDITSVWQPTENMIIVRWTVEGIPRIPWESRGRFDGTSEYKLDKKGKIYEHKVHNIALNGPQKFQVLAVEQLIQSIGCPSTPKPTCFEFSSSPSWRTSIGAFIKLSTVKRYFASMVKRIGKSEAEAE